VSVEKIADIIKQCVEAIGNVVGFFILAIVGITTYEVIARYAFNAPTNWAWPINKQIFGVFVMVAGSYALIHKSHIRIELLYDRFPTVVKRVIHWFTLFAALCFLGSLLWKSGSMGLDAWNNKEKMVGVFKMPLYPLKMMIPIGTALFISACLAVYIGGQKKGDKK
jgi:TRAP-type mannitol/chloroaromatic compound transport system permease small subunit